MGNIQTRQDQQPKGIGKMRSKGFAYEKIALKHLRRNGLKLITSNYTSKVGEIDLIMKDKQTLVFVEVRYRKSNKFGSALESITSGKQSKITRTASLYLSENKLWHLNSRFDVVTIDSTDRPHSEDLIWIKSAFST